MKAQRQATIVALVRRQRVTSQEQLRELLRAEGVDVTQATLSRDIRELGLAKIADAEGPRYVAGPAAESVHPPLDQLVQTLLLSVDGVGPFLVVRTPAGSANALASAVDHAGWADILGTIAGDDTFLIITRGEAARRAVRERLEDLTSTGD